ncbi:putative membrane protein [Methanonatronarchaeum thermophilum]|uniref:Putative membrane protein n=1 Tax=Methanonatronarchaeum thermophilum TaxID=1927129 RepID=A0A1Y3GGX3_9EURY|nr:SHOCT domain-containing protein [Methanonatronarchaeum thermophilum]OUJ18616.1 putative membrane protein [Methanonatronarchaeum thermophilum]
MSFSATLPIVFQHHPMEGWGVWGFGWIPLLLWLLIFIVIAVLIYQDAEKRGMNGLLWFILILIPYLGLLFLVIYLITREEKPTEKQMDRDPKKILDERLARGEITSEEHEELKEKLE